MRRFDPFARALFRIRAQRNVRDDRRGAVQTAAGRDENIIAVSAVTGDGMAALLDAIARHLAVLRHETRLTLSFSEGRKRAWLHAEGVVEEEEQTDDGFALTVYWSDRQEQKFRAM